MTLPVGWWPRSPGADFPIRTREYTHALFMAFDRDLDYFGMLRWFLAQYPARLDV